MKKKILLQFIFILIIVISGYPQQSLIISFKARHYEGEDLGLDSILIKNITRNCDTMLYAPDTILYYNYFVGMGEHKNLEDDFISATYPNPVVNNKVSFNINLSQTERLKLELFDLFGRKLCTYNKILSTGNYKFKLNLGKRGTYILTANYNNIQKSRKIINSSHGIGEKFMFDMVSMKTVNNFKSKFEEGGFWYEPGDTLWYVGYAQTPHGIAGSDVLEGIPQSQEHIILHIVEGLPCPDNVAVKHAGQLYPTVILLNECWFKENLNVGTMIVGDSNMVNNDIIEKYCYDNNPVNCQEYGALYQWNELMDYTEEEATQGICPQGWHIPTSDEYFSIIEDFDGVGCKERGNEHWEVGYNVGGDNKKGFTALGSGYRQNTTLFEQLGTTTSFHSSTKLTYDWVWYLELNRNNNIGFGTMLKITGLSVRCIKD